MVTFDVSKESGRFLSFIRNLRRDVRDENHPTLVEGVDRLSPVADNPETFDIELVHGNYLAALRVRSDNLYVIGFRNGANRWFEFSHDNRGSHMIDGATWLPYNGSYTNNGIGSLNERDLYLGRWAVEEAIKYLASFSGPGTMTGFHLRTLIVNLIESTRFDTIANHVAPHMSNPGPERELRLTGREISLIRSWGALSRALRSRLNDPEGPNPFRRFYDLGIQNAGHATAVLGMVLFGICRSSNIRRQRRSAGGEDADAQGLTLVNVVGVLVNNIQGNSLYGTISITDTFGTMKLFNRDKDHAQSVGPRGWVDITWPTIPIFGADDLVIDVHLDNQAAHGQVAWNPRDASSIDYDRIQIRQIKGQSGCSVEVHFAVLTNAVLAVPHVVMKDGDAETVREVYGKITASVGMAYCGGGLNYMLFQEERSQYVNVPCFSPIPLQREAMPVPLCSALQVSADMWEADSITPDDHMADGSVAFNPRLYGMDDKDIHGPSGRVTMYISWYI